MTTRGKQPDPDATTPTRPQRESPDLVPGPLHQLAKGARSISFGALTGGLLAYVTLPQLAGLIPVGVVVTPVAALTVGAAIGTLLHRQIGNALHGKVFQQAGRWLDFYFAEVN